MNRSALIICLLSLSCNTGNLEVIMDIPSVLKEVSGIAIVQDSELIWMMNDSGNKPILYGLDNTGNIVRAIKINANNRDWEDLTSDPKGNIYIGNFGNNANDRKNLSILKILKKDLNSKDEITPQVISFSYPEQEKFPPKKSKWHFDCESFFFYKDSLYLFTKSRTPNDLGKTNLYKLPAQPGVFKAEFMDSFSTCNNYGCWITSADINNAGKEVVLLTEHSVFVFSDFKDTNFFSGNANQYSFDYLSQKESVCYKNDSILYIADERSAGRGGNLYQFKLN